MPRPVVCLLVLVLAVPPALAHHRQTPPVVALTTAGDATLPRLPPPGRKAVAVVVDDGIRVLEPFRDPTTPALAFAAGTNANPALGKNGRTVAWDSDADPLGGGPGRQLLVQRRLVLSMPLPDPTGTSENPALDVAGTSVAFESTGDLAATGNAGARQIFHAALGGVPVQVSQGQGTSRNPSMARRGRSLVYDSTSDPATGADTGTAQIWLASLLAGTRERITAGAGASERPSFSNDGRVVVFESRADLPGDGHDTGTPQIFAYDTITRTFAQVTSEPGGCTGASAARIKRDWRIAYVCGDAAYFTMLRANQRHHVDTAGAAAAGIVPQADAHFLLVATTADLVAGGTTPGRRIYMLNLFARPATPVAGTVTWFPFQGLAPL